MDGYLIVGNKDVVEDADSLAGSSSRGKVVTEKRKRTEIVWEARELDDCIAEADQFKRTLLSSLQHRFDQCSHESLHLLAKCLDLHQIISHLSGKRKSSGSPYCPLNLARYGKDEFGSFCRYTKQLIESKGIVDLHIHEDLSSLLHDKIKAGMAEVIWGDLFTNIGCQMFQIVSGELKGKTLQQLAGDPYVEEFSVESCSREFTLENTFSIKLNTMAGNVSVKLNESLLYKAIYENSRLSSLIVPEGCYLIDLSYNLGGSEALAETFFGVMTYETPI